jgi:hypothetical protein
MEYEETVDEVDDEDRLLSPCLMSGTRKRKIGKDNKCFIMVASMFVLGGLRDDQRDWKTRTV